MKILLLLFSDQTTTMSAEDKITPEGLIRTENGALSFPSTMNCCVDLFFKTVRGITEENLLALLEESWRQCPEATLRLIFQTRDCRGGKGEKKIFYDAYKWLFCNHSKTALKNLPHIPFFGCWKDLLAIASVCPEIENEVINVFVSQLKKDRTLLDVKDFNSQPQIVSLCAKWAPTEKHHFDNSQKLAKKLAEALCEGRSNALAEYRKKYLVPLRTQLRVTERYMCANEWDNIPYSTVPSRCMFRCKKAFKKHDEDRFQKFLLDAAMGKVKLQGKQMYPHELVKVFMRGGEDLVTECQWKSMMDGLKEQGSLEKAIVLSDVSGSMSGTPMEVAIALGLVISEVSSGPFNNMIITFESNPKFHHVQGDSLHSRVKDVMRMSWGGSTDLQKAMDLILQMAIDNNVPQSDMPDKLFIISDMQFNQADRNYATNHQTVVNKFTNAGYEVPLIVYWNVRANTVDFPALADTPGVALLAGYSPSLMKVVMDGCDLDAEIVQDDPAAPPQKKEVNPEDIMKKAISDERYDILSL